LRRLNSRIRCFVVFGKAACLGQLSAVVCTSGLSVGRIGVLAALYPAVWGIGQLATGALSERIGRKWPIATGMWTQAVAIGCIAAVRGFWPWAGAAVLLGAGTAMAYPTLLPAVGDVAHPAWRATAVGVYRLWRDAKTGGKAVSALAVGGAADWRSTGGLPARSLCRVRWIVDRFGLIATPVRVE
jgi:MFS family permease